MRNRLGPCAIALRGALLGAVASACGAAPARPVAPAPPAPVAVSPPTAPPPPTAPRLDVVADEASLRALLAVPRVDAELGLVVLGATVDGPAGPAGEAARLCGAEATAAAATTAAWLRAQLATGPFGAPSRWQLRCGDHVNPRVAGPHCVIAAPVAGERHATITFARDRGGAPVIEALALVARWGGEPHGWAEGIYATLERQRARRWQVACPAPR